jgi:hypothetical protein
MSNCSNSSWRTQKALDVLISWNKIVNCFDDSVSRLWSNLIAEDKDTAKNI